MVSGQVRGSENGSVTSLSGKVEVAVGVILIQVCTDDFPTSSIYDRTVSIVGVVVLSVT